IFGTSNPDQWFRYNNRGYEYNPGRLDFQAANHFLRTPDPLNSPRVGYEKCGLYASYGGDRVFESLPFFSGRQTMEGIHYASSWAARFMAFSQTVYSKEIKTPRSYILSRLNADALPAYMDLYNLSQLILMTPEAREAVESSSHFRKEAEFGDIAIYRYKESDGRYVDVPRRMPLLYRGGNWEEDFYQWYREGRHLDLLMVPGSYVRDEEDRNVLATEAANVEELGGLRSDLLDRRALRVETRLEHHRIEFTTNRRGLPHLIKVSYYPNWKVQGANGVYPVSPHLMLVIPREPRVVLTYGSNPWEIGGFLITGVTLFFLFFSSSWRLVSGSRFRISDLFRISRFDIRILNKTPAPVERFYAKHKPFIITIVLLLCAGLIAGGAINRNRTVRAYINGHRFYQKAMDLKGQGRDQAARPLFEKAVRTMSPVFDPVPIDDHQDVIHCMLFTAASHENLGQWSTAETLYRRIIEEYPFSRYSGEAYVKIGRIKRNEGRIEEANEFFRKAMREDPWSFWATYAEEELKKK
ncbi:MAG: tetratricopeptide repeat protein, partial [Desulfobacterales bacterium]|nr:tetratricopeptide repeat protein [Desulfobacterales bacterium]